MSKGIVKNNNDVSWKRPANLRRRRSAAAARRQTGWPWRVARRWPAIPNPKKPKS